MKKLNILIVDDEVNILKTLGTLLRMHGYAVETTNRPSRVKDMLERGNFQVLLTDMRMPEIDGIQLTELLREEFPELSIVVMSAYGTIKDVVKAMRKGAFDYLTKPLDEEELLLMLDKVREHHELVREVKLLRRELKAGSPYDGLVGRSKSMQAVYEFIDKAAGSDFSVLITGETGTGKTMTARAIHKNSGRKNGPFVLVSCGALSEALINSELFGHVKGAFTGAVRERIGKIRGAHTGTLFLDEVDTLSLSTQVKLLNVLEEKKFEPLGGDKSIEVDIRIMVATSKDLFQAVEEGEFRKDLYYRLNVLCLELPPLRERKEDISQLASNFLSKIGRSDVRVFPDVMNVLLRYDWPGNIRELENVFKSALVSLKGDILSRENLPASLRSFGETAPLDLRGTSSLKEKIMMFEKYLIEEKLRETRGNVAKAARQLGSPLRTMRRRLVHHNVEPGTFKSELPSK